MSVKAGTKPWHYGGAVLATALAVFVRWLLDPWLGDRVLFAPLFAAVAFAVWLGGYRPGLLAVSLGLLAWGLLFVTLGVDTPRNLIDLLTYLATSGILVAFGEAFHIARRHSETHQQRLEDEAAQRQRAEADNQQLHHQLRERVRELQTLLDILPVGVWQADPACQRIIGNRAAYAMLGMTEGSNASVTGPEAGASQGFRCVVDGKEVPPSELPMQRVARTGQPVHGYEHDVVFDDGTIKTVLCNVAPLMNGDQQVQGVIGAYADITERKRAERETANLGLRLQSLVDNTPLAVVEWDADFRISRWSRRAEELFGWSAGEVVGKRVSEFRWIHEDDEARVTEAVARLLDPSTTFVPCRNRNRTRTGETVLMEWYNTVLHDESGRIVAVLSLGLDVTEQARAEEELGRRVEEVETLMEFFPIAVIRAEDAECRRVTGNPAAHKLLRVQAGNNLSKTPTADLPPPAYRTLQNGQEVPPERLPMQYACRHGVEVRDTEFQILFEDGDSRHIYCYATPLFDRGGQVRGCVFAALDITGLKQAQEALQTRTAELEALLSSAPLGFAFFDRSHRYLRVNEQLAAINGIPVEAHIGRTITELLPVNARVVKPIVDQVFATGKAVADLEVAGETPARPGERRHWLTTFYPVRGEHGVVAVGATVMEITDRKRAEEALREQEERLRLAVEATGVGIYDFDPVTRRQVFSDQARAIWGFPPGTELTPEVVLEAIHPDDRDWVRAAAEASLAPQAEGRFEVRHRIVRPDGEIRWVQVSGRTTTSCCCGMRSIGTMLDVTEAERSERQLRASEERFRLAAEAVNGLIYDHDVRTGMVWRSQGLLALTGYNPEEAEPTARWWVNLWHTDDVRDGDRLARDVYQGAISAFEHDYRVRHRDGHYVQVWERGRILRDEEGKPIRVIGCTVDVTERKQRERQLAEANRRLQESLALLDVFLGTAPVGLCFLDTSFRYVRVNDTLARLNGLPVEAHLGRTIQEVLPALWSAIAPHLRRVQETGQPVANVEVRAAVPSRGPDEGVWLSSYYPIRLGADLIGYGIVAQDVTDAKRAEESLRASQRAEQERATELETLLRAAPTLIWIAHDPACRSITGNAASYQVLGMTEGTNVSATADGALARPFREYRNGVPVPPGDLPIQRASATGRPVEGEELSFHFADGTVRHFYGNAVPILTAEGAVRGCVAAFMDITALKNAQQALKEADRRKDEFLATLAHELRNPLAPVRHAIQILHLRESPSEEVVWARDMIDRQIQQMTRLIDDLMDVSRIARGRLELRKERIELAKVVQGAVETSRPLIEKQQHALALALPPEPIYLDGDLTRLAQVFANLLNNAAKYTAPGGHIWLTAERQGGEVVVSVRDTGEGIPPDMLPRVWEMFTQVGRTLQHSQGGVGIGLHLVQRLVEMHGGRVEAHSEGVGKGSEFLVRLPLLIEPSLQPTPTAGENHLTGSAVSLRILVADDNRDAAESLALLLRILGHDIRTANDGAEAVQVADAFRPEVILLDIGMPKLNGYDAARQIRQRDWSRGTLLIAVTGWGQEEDRHRSEEAGFNHHTVKPVDPQALIKLLAELQSTRAGTAR
ncbi:MAG: PAS domain S-box protein [Gemmataceae bacterium]